MTSGEAFVAMGRLFDQARCRPTFLKQPAIPELVLQSIKHGADIGHYHMHAWVIVPNHVHLLLTARVSLLKLLGSLKAAGSNSKTTL